MTITAGSWGLPSSLSLINNLNATTTSFTTSNSAIQVSSAVSGTFDITANSGIYEGYLSITDNQRPVPTVTLSSTNICVSNSITASFTESGSGWSPTNSAFLWEVYNGATATGSPVFTSTVANPTLGPFLTAGTYLLKFQVTEQCCGTSVPVYQTITVGAGTTAASAGPDQFICGTAATLGANAPVTGTGVWSIISGGGGTFTAPTSPNSGFSGLQGAIYVLRWTISNLPCSPSTDDVIIDLRLPPMAASAGPDQIICGATASLAANTPAIGSGNWSIVSGTGGSFSLSTDPNTTFTGTAGNSYVLRWTVSNAPCTATSDDVAIQLVQSPTVANAGSDQTLCGGATTLVANTATVGTPVWNIVAGAGGAISAPSSPNSGFTGIPGNSYTLAWTISNAPCPSISDQVVLNLVAPPAIADAGLDQQICDTLTSLAAAAAPIGIGNWSILSGTGATIYSPSNPNSAFSGLTGTPYLLQWEVTNSPCPASADAVVVTFFALPAPPNAGPDQVVCDSVAILSGNVPTVGTGLWLNPYGSGTIITPTNPNTAVAGLAVGPNFFQWEITNGPCPTTIDEVRITRTVALAPAFAGNDTTVCTATMILQATTPTDGVGAWTVISGPGIVATPTLATSMVTGLSTTIPTVLRWTVTNAPCAAVFDNITITRLAALVSAAGTDISTCGTVATLNATAPTVGTGTWTLGGGSGVITAPTFRNSSVTGLSAGASFFNWTVSNGICPDAIDQVMVTSFENPTPANAGTDQSVCAPIATLSANNPSIGIGTWTALPPGPIIANPGSPSTTVSGLVTGSNLFRWTVVNGVCPASTDDVVIDRVAGAPVANAGADQLICDSSTVLIGNAPGSNATGTWTLVFGSGTILNPTNQSTVVTNLGQGDNFFRWTIAGGPCPATDDLVKVTRSLSPTIANAGAGQTVCGTTATLTANQPIVGTGAWTLVSGSGVIVSPASFNSLVTGLGPGANFFLWTISNGSCPSTQDLVNITREVTPVVANAGPDQTVCSTSSVLAGNAAPTYGGTWTLVSGAGSITSPTLPGSAVTGLGIGPNTLRWTVNNGVCPASTDDVVITRNALPTVANAGADSTVCVSTYTLAGNTPVVGTGAWTLVAGGGAVTAPTTPNSGITSLGLGSNTFRWTISNGVCPASIDDVVLTRSTLPTPSNAGPNQTVCDTLAILNADAPFVGTGMWTLIGGSATIVNPAQRNSNVTHLGVGINTFRWTVTNSVCPASVDDVLLIRDNYPSIAYAGADTTICATTVTMRGNAPAVGVGNWTLTTGAGTLVMPSSPTSVVNGLAVGNNTFTWTIGNGVCPVNSDAVVITRDQSPTAANAGADQAICNHSATLTGNVPAVGVGAWTLIGGSGTLANANAASTTVTNLGLGPNTFRWTIGNGVCPPTTDDVVITSDNTPPVARCRNVTLHLDGAGVAPLTISQVDSSSSDNCAIATMSLNITTFLCAQIGTNSVVLVLADSNGNSANCTAAITVLDSTRPTIGCPPTQYVLLNSNCAAALPNYLPIGTTADNCSNPPTMVQNPTGGSPISGSGPMTVTLTSTDGSGNANSCAFTVIKQDSVAPVVICPIPHFLTLDANCTVLLPNYTDSTTATDNCGGPLTRSQVPAAGSLLTGPGYTNVVVTVADAGGMAATCGFSVLRRDLIAPTIVCVDTIFASTDSALCTAVVTYTVPIGIDNCLNPQTTLTSGLGSGATFSLGPHAEVYTVSDSSGNSSSCTTIVMVEDHAPPSITNCPLPITVSVGNPRCHQFATWLQPNGTDNCVLPTFTSNHQPNDSFPVGVTVVQYIAVDGAGNRDTCSFAVTVLDVGPPSIICPPDTAVVPPNWGPTAVVNYPSPTATDACAPTSIALIGGIASGGTFPAGSTLNTFVATDTSGNTDSCSFTVVVLQKVTAFPACSDFEAGKGDWTSGGIRNSWEFGEIPTYPGDNVWATSLLNNYNNNERSWVQGPTYDMTYLKKPMATFAYLDQTQGGSDGVVLQASTDNGLTWATVGGLGTGKKWYNALNIAGQPGLNNGVGVGWSGSAPTWTQAAVRLDHYIGAPQVSFRFQMGADAAGTTFGFAFDDFCIQERRQNVLHETFVNSNNTQSLSAAQYMYGLVNQNQLDAFMVEYHLQDQLLLPQAPARSNYYQVPTLPWVQVDGDRVAGVPSSVLWNQDSIYHHIFEEPLFVFDTLYFNPAFPGGAIQPTAQVRFIAGGVLGDTLSLHMVVVERVLTNAGHTHEWVMRQMLPLATGTTLTKQWRKDTIALVSNSWVLQNIASQAEIGVVAFVQNKTTREVYQAAYYGVDGPVVGGAAAQAADEPQLHVYPNPISVGSGTALLHIDFEHHGAAQYQLLNTLGQAVAEGVAHGQRFDIAVADLPTGTYYLRLTTGKSVVVRKVLVVGE
jgi:HYR domain